MKLLLLSLIVLVSLHADEIKRIESIVNDISKLRAQHESCQADLEISELKLMDETSKNKKYQKIIKDLKNKIKVQEKQIKSKDKIINSPKKKNIKIVKIKENTIKTLVLEKCEEPNPFPKLMMKKEKQKLEYFKASAFRLNKSADIYDAINGQAIDSWENKRSFTSNQRTKNWIKITGFFENKIWQKADVEMWVKADDAIQR